MRKWKMILAIIGIIVLLLGAVSLVFKESILMAVGNYLVIQDELKPADVIHVIAGEDYRTNYAIYLYKQGYGKVIFFTGGLCQFHGYDHGARGRELALNAGIPMEAIAIDDSSVTSTYSETLLLKDWVDQSPDPVRSVIVVSDPFHMRRARWTTRRVLGEGVEIIMAPVPFEQTPYQQQWWADSKSDRYVRDEYKKSVYYLLRYQLSWGWMRDWLASFDDE